MSKGKGFKKTNRGISKKLKSNTAPRQLSFVTKRFSSSNISFSKLNPLQKEAVETIDGPVLIVAGPGTGKTTLLSYRIANILQTTDVPADSILALTFTESGVIAMKNKLLSLIGTEAYKVNIYTFHGFCNYVITEYSEYFPEASEFSVLSDLERILIFDSLLKDLDLKYLAARFDNTYFLKKIADFISELKREGITIDRFLKIIEIEKEVLENLPKESKKSRDGLTTKYKNQRDYIKKLQEILKIYKEYEKRLKDAKRYDYEDMIAFVLEKIEKEKELLSLLQERFNYILVDEYQDTNTAQNKVVFKLAEFWGENANVFAVGDDDQSIYRFQGASISNIMDFIETFRKNLKIITLKENYRSQQNILDAAYELIKHSTTNLEALLPDIKKHLKSNVDYKKEPVYYGEFTTNVSENLFIVDKIKELIKNGTLPEEIAILVRNHWQMDDIIDLLQRNNISYVRIGGDNALENRIVSQFIDLLKLVSYVDEKPSDDSLFFKVMHYKFLGLPYTDVIKLARYISTLNREKDVDDKAIRSVDLVLSNNWEKLAESIGISKEGAKKIKDFYEKLTKWYSDSYNHSLAKYIEIIINESGLLDYILTLPSKFEDLNALNSFFLEVKAITANKPFMPIKEFLEALDLIISYNIKIKIRDLVRPEGGVNILTAHASKGLEFDYVFLPKFTDKFWGAYKRENRPVRLPSYVVERDLSDKSSLVVKRLEEIDKLSKSNKKDNLLHQLAEEDARRLFYVALTRARRSVFITFPHTIVGQNGKDTEHVRSRFIEELPTDKIKILNTDKYNNIENQDLLAGLLAKTSFPSVYISTVSEDEYLKKIVSTFKLSPSALVAFLKDPEEFYLNYLLKVPSVDGIYAVYGTAFHKALQKLYTNLRDKKEYLDHSTLLSEFEKVVNSSLLLEDQKKRLIKAAKDDLLAYLDFAKKTPRRPMFMEKYVSLNLASAPLTGVLDLIEYIDYDKGLVRIVDFKTGKSFSKNQILGKASVPETHFLNIPEFRHKFKLQLYFYKILFDLYPELNRGRLTAVSGRIEFVQPKKHTNIIPPPVDIEYDPSDLEALKKLIIDSWERIKRFEW